MSDQIIITRWYSRRTVLLAGLFFAAIAVAAIAVSAMAFKGSSEHPVKLPPNTPSKPVRSQERTPVQAQTSVTRPRLEAELITITPTGFEPSEITRPAGQVLLAAENRSGLDDLTIRIGLDDGVRLAQARASRTRLRWSGVVTLVPGRYTITEANHPEWVCHINITAQ